MNATLKRIAGASKSRSGALWRRALFQVLALAGPLAAAAGLATLTMRNDLADIGFAAAVVGALVAAAAWLTLFSTLADLAGQHARDLEAGRIFDALKAGRKPPPFTLYLRPFAATNEIQSDTIEALVRATARGPAIFASTSLELEQQIERAARRVGPLIALGEPLEHIGAGRIRIDEASWRSAVELLTDGAKLIILLPSSRPGTLWEVERLLNSNLIERTVVIDPPNPPKRARAKYRQSAEWEQVRNAFASRNFKLPADSRVGQLIYYGRQREPAVHARLDMDAEDNIARFFRRVIRLSRPPEAKGIEA